MTPTPRPPGRRPSGARRWWAVGIVGALLTTAGVVGVWPSAPATPEAAASPPPAPAVAAATPSWSEAIGIPADATEEERLRIELSYDLVAVPTARYDQLRALPDVSEVSPVTRGDTVYVAVPAAEVPTILAVIPEARFLPNEIVTASADQTPTPSWGLDAVDNTAALTDDHYLYDSTGAGVTAFIVDSGVQSSHPDFGGRVDAANGHSEVDDGRGTEDCNGHGTHVAGTVGSTTYGVAKDVRIVPVRVLGCGREGSGLALLYAMFWIYDNHDGANAVINMSLGLPRNAFVDDIIDDGIELGFVIVVAAGNETQDACNVSPAGAPDLLTVGAIDSSRTLAWYSNYGPCVDILAPGSGITSTYLDSSTAVFDGTSMATPHVVGLAARLRQLHPAWGPAEVQAALTTAAATGHVVDLPAGTPNLLAALPAVPRITALTATADPAGVALAWTTNDIGTPTAFSVTVTDTSTGRAYPVVVAGLHGSTVFTEVASGRTYSVSVTGTVRMPAGTASTTDTVITEYTAP